MEGLWLAFYPMQSSRGRTLFHEGRHPLGLPTFDRYAICNLRGGIGKTSLAFNLSYLADNLLAVDTCPQGNLSYFYDNGYYQNVSTTVNDVLLPYFFPGLGKASRVAQFIGATNPIFRPKKLLHAVFG